MKFNTFGIASASLVGILGMLWASSNANAQVTGVVSANGQIYFSSDSDTYNYASPSVVTNPGTGLTTVNANNALNGLPGARRPGIPIRSPSLIPFHSYRHILMFRWTPSPPHRGPSPV